jgi:predicted ATPase
MAEKVFVNRTVELAKLEGFLADVRNDKTRTVFLFGDSGIGKKTLAVEFLKKHEPYLQIWHNCESTEKKTPFAPILGLFGNKSLINSLDQEFQTRIESVLKNLKNRRKESDEIGMKPEEFYYEMTSLLADISLKKTLIIFINNFHWSDLSTVSFIKHIASAPKKARILMIATYSQELEGAELISEAITTMAMDRNAYVMILERFDETTSEVLMEKLLGTPVPPSFSKQIFEDTQGHPLFMTSIIESLVEDGTIDPNDYTWTSRVERLELKLPKSVKELLTEKVKVLEDESQRILRAASVLGTQFKFEDLANVMTTDKEDLHTRLSTLSEKKLIFQEVEAEEESYSFDHPSLRETIYEEIDPSERKALHMLAANVLESVHGEDADFAYYLAHHFSLSGQYEKAFNYAKIAGENSLQQNAPEEAARHFEDSLASLEKAEMEGKNGLKHDIVLKIGDSNFRTGNWTGAQERYGDSLRIGIESKDKQMASISHRKLGEVLRFKGSYPEAKAHFQESLVISVSLVETGRLSQGNGKL